MARTTATAVKDVLRLGTEGGDYDDVNNPSLTPYIDSVSLFVTRVAACATAKGKTLNAAELEMIERWLAAHAYALSDQTYASSSAGGASASFHGQTGKGLESTRYGQHAMDIDYSGCVRAVSMKKTAGGFWLGKPPSDQIDYDQRD